MSRNKKRRNAREYNIRNRKEIKYELNILPYSNYIFGILLLAIFALSLYLRTVIPYASVFRDGVVAFASDDAVMHMRLVENTLYNFPHRIFYDVFTEYPYGGIISWAPLWDQTIATLSLIAGMGSYNMQTVNTIGAFLPAVYGALVVFPVYFIGKQLVNRSTGLLAAFMIAVLPGGFFTRSTLGFSTHHVAEVLYSTATLLFFILSIKAGRERNIKFTDIRLKEKPVIYAIVAGIMLASYHLTWHGASFFILIFLIYILIQYVIDVMRGRSTDYLAVAAIPMFLIDLIFVLPYINLGQSFTAASDSWFQIVAPLIGIGLPIILSIISILIKKRGYKSYYYPAFLAGFFMFGTLVIRTILPQIYNAIVQAPDDVFLPHISGGASTVAQVLPISEKSGELFGSFPITGFLPNDNFVSLFIIAVLVFIGYKFFKRQRPEELLFLVWNIVMFLALYGQMRWEYYFAVNVALMVGYTGSILSERILKFGGWEWSVDKIYLKNIGLNHIFSSVLVVLLVIFFVYPSLVTTAIGAVDQPPLSTFGGGEPSGGGFSEWLNVLNWMRYNTPDPGLDYYAIYEQPTNGTSPYPESAYGVMSWWDYGHIITYWAHRIPNANPFQSGIGGGEQHLPGASTFLTAKSEEEANKVLDALGINGKPGARYIVSNGYMAYGIQPVFATWNNDNAIADPALSNPDIKPDPMNYYESVALTDKGAVEIPGLRVFTSMEGKLHIFDGNGLKQYRLVHESPINPNTEGGYQEKSYKNIYNVLYGGNIPVEDSGLVKVFEYVKGAKITGSAPPNTTVTLTNIIKTNIGRTIQYSQNTSSNGTYEFTVPYSTLGPIPGETQFDTKPTGPYKVTAGNISKQIDISEKNVLEGQTITLNLV